MKPSQARKAFDELQRDFVHLLEIHEQLTGDGKGRRAAKVEALNKGAVIFCCACWESYVEDVLQEKFNQVLDAAKSPAEFSDSFRRYVCNEEKISVQNIHDMLANFISDNWRGIFKKHSNQFLLSSVDKFHTPKYENVDFLAKKLLGIDEISKTWSWRKMNYQSARKKLDEFVKMRGDIAHRLSSKNQTISKADAAQFMNHVEQLVDCIEHHLFESPPK